jgi:hypothetical protein
MQMGLLKMTGMFLPCSWLLNFSLAACDNFEILKKE